MIERVYTNTKKGPLSGIVVADFSRVLAGPYCSMILADLGAKVIKVESEAGDDTRRWLPPVFNDEISTYFMSANRNKESITLDFNDSNDLETAYEIIDRADILIENFKPGGLVKFGLDHAQTSKRWPELIHASITGFGAQGGAHLAGYDLLVQALSGFMHITGDPDGKPQKAGVAIFDVLAGLQCTIGILAALHEKHRSNLGQTVEVNLMNVALSSLVNQTSGYVGSGVEPMRMGNDHPSIFPYGPFKAKDKDLIIACGNDGQFRNFVEVIGKPELADDPRFGSMSLRNQNREVLRNQIEEVLCSRSASEWYELLVSKGLLCAPIMTISQGIEFADSLGLEPVVNIEDEFGVNFPTIRSPIELSRTPVTYIQPPPRLGQHSKAIREWITVTPRKNAHLSSQLR